MGQPGEMLPVLRGVPLFWSWSPGGERLAAQVGSRTGSEHAARVVLVNVASRQIIGEVSDRAGDFRVPAWSPTEALLAYVERQEDGGNMLHRFDVPSGQSAPVAAMHGSVAAVWSADGQALAFGETVRPGSPLFSSLRGLDLSSGRVTSLLDEADRAITGFFWSPAGNALLYLSVDVRRSHLRWHRLSQAGGETRESVRFLPSREQTFVFSFLISMPARTRRSPRMAAQWPLPVIASGRSPSTAAPRPRCISCPWTRRMPRPQSVPSARAILCAGKGNAQVL